MNKSQQGFTLVEVILAIIIFTMAAGILVESVFNISDELVRLESQDSREADIRFVRRTILAIPEREKIEDGDDIETLNSGRATWEAVIEETGIVDLFLLKLSVEFDGEGVSDEPLLYELYVLRPAWSDVTDRGALLDEKRELIDTIRQHREFQ